MKDAIIIVAVLGAIGVGIYAISKMKPGKADGASGGIPFPEDERDDRPDLLERIKRAVSSDDSVRAGGQPMPKRIVIAEGAYGAAA